MGILIGADSRVICQGMTGRMGTFHTEQCISYGTNVVGGVRPGKGGSKHLGLPVFDRVADAAAQTGANVSMIFVPPANAADAMIEAIKAAIPVIVCVTERVPVLDMLRVKHALESSSSVLVGPNSQGLLAPDVCKVGVMPVLNERKGSIGIISRSASLTSEVVEQTSRLRMGQSTTVGVGGDPVHGIGFVDSLKLFLDDKETDGVILIGEIGGDEEEQAAAFLRANKPAKPVVAFVAGRHAPTARRMGHAGTVHAFGTGGAQEKIDALRAAGAVIADNAAVIGQTMKHALGR